MAYFHFLRPWWLLAIVPLALLLWFAYRSRRNGWQAVVDPHLLPHLTEAGGALGGKRRLWLPFIAVLIAVIALAGPAWRKLPQPVYKTEFSRVVVLDLSRSMDATDVRPSRLVRAKHKVLDLLGLAREGQTALVVFSAEAFVVSPLTDDAKTIAAMVPTLSTGLMPVRGSRIDRGIDKALELLDQAHARGGQVILLTDGLDAPDLAMEAARRARNAGHRLSVLGVGTADGAPIPLKAGGFLNDANGAIVIPRLEEDRLRRLAQVGGGDYTSLGIDDTDLKKLMRIPANAAGKGASDNQQDTDLWRDEGPWLVLALLPLAALAFRRGAILGVLAAFLVVPRPADASEWSDLWWRPDQQGARALEQGDPARAADLFRDPAWQGTAHYRAGDFGSAAKAFADLGDGAEAHYNRGNALAKQGKLQEAIEAYQQALTLNPRHEDARYNRDLVQRLLQRQQSGEQRQQGQREGEGSKAQQGNESGDGSDGDGREPSQTQGDSAGERADNGGKIGQAGAAGDDEADKAQARAQAEQAQNGTEQQTGPTAAAAQDQDAGKDEAPRGRAESQGSSESSQAVEQWLRRIPDDPGGLLRQKFLRQHQRQQPVEAEKPW